MIAPQTVFEVLSPGNRAGKMVAKFQFYERYGVQEYYVYDPDGEEFAGWQRQGSVLRPILDTNGWTSPLLGIKFDLSTERLRIFGPDGRQFPTALELALQRAQEEKEKLEAQHRAAETAAKLERLTAQLKAFGIDADA